jgi:hypothetical protein
VRAFSALVIAIVVLCIGVRADAQPSDEDRAAAQLLFDEGQQLKKDGEMEAACEKFAASQALDPAVGTQINLADCYEKIGRTASAWVNYVEVAQNPEAGAKRAKYAKQHADALAPRLTKLKIEIEERVPGMALTRDGVAIPEKTWGIGVPIDPGPHTLVATAPDKERWSRKVDVSGEGEEVSVSVPPLIDSGPGAGEGELPDAEPAPEPTTKDEGGGNGQKVAGGVVLGLGGAAILVGAVLAGVAHSKYGESLDHCKPDDATACDQEGVDLRGEAQGLQKGYAGSFIAGGALLLAGIVVLATAPSSDAKDVKEESWQLAPLVGPGTVALLVGRRF